MHCNAEILRSCRRPSSRARRRLESFPGESSAGFLPGARADLVHGRLGISMSVSANRRLKALSGGSSSRPHHTRMGLLGGLPSDVLKARAAGRGAAMDVHHVARLVAGHVLIGQVKPLARAVEGAMHLPVRCAGAGLHRAQRCRMARPARPGCRPPPSGEPAWQAVASKALGIPRLRRTASWRLMLRCPSGPPEDGCSCGTAEKSRVELLGEGERRRW